MDKITEMETYTEAFLWHLENRMESPKVEQGETAKELIVAWLTMADNEIAKLKEELEIEKSINDQIMH